MIIGTTVVLFDGYLRFFIVLTIFQSYQDAVRMIMKGCVQWNHICGRKILPPVEMEPGLLAK